MKRKSKKKSRLVVPRPGYLTFVASAILSLVLQSVPLASMVDAAPPVVPPSSTPTISVQAFHLSTGHNHFDNGDVTGYEEGSCVPIIIEIGNGNDSLDAGFVLNPIYDFAAGTGVVDLETMTTDLDHPTDASELSDFSFPGSSLATADFPTAKGSTVTATVTGPFSGSGSGTTAVSGSDASRHYQIVLSGVDKKDTAEIYFCARLGGNSATLVDGMNIGVAEDTSKKANITATAVASVSSPTLTLTKAVSSGLVPPDAFSFVVSPEINGQSVFDIADGEESVSITNVPDGSYSITETGPEGYALQSISGCPFDGQTATATVAAGETPTDAACTFTNAVEPSTLNVVKHVDNGDGGLATADQFTITVKDASQAIVASIAGSEAGTPVSLDAGTYTVSESGPSGYASDFSACGDGSITIGENEELTCSIINDDIAPPPAGTATLIVQKNLLPNDGVGTLTSPADFSFQVNGEAAIAFEADGENQFTVEPGAYSVTEVAVTGYTPSFENCDVNLSAGDTATCVITNDDDDIPLLPPTGGILTVIKHVVGPDSADQFTITVSNDSGEVTSFPGSETGTSSNLDANTYTVSESSDLDGYAATFSDSCPDGNVTITDGQTVVCTITNTLEQVDPGFGKITVVKVVDNDGGGTLGVTDFPLFVGDDPVISGEEHQFIPGTYVISETNKAGYTPSFSADCPQGVLLLGQGDVKTCTITNTFVPPEPPATGTLIVKKIVINDDGGSSKATDFLFVVDGGEESIQFGDDDDGDDQTGETVLTLSTGLHSISEVSPTGYSTTYSAGCSEASVGQEPVTCIVTNDDNDPETSVFSFTISTSGRGHGFVSVDQDERIHCDGDDEESVCTGNFEEGSVITLHANPSHGSNFNDSWSGACSGNNPTCSVTVTGNTTVNANFSLNSTGGGGGGGCGTCGVLPPGGIIPAPSAPAPVPPPGQVLGLVDEIPAPPPGQVLGLVDQLPVTGVPAYAVVLLFTPLLWALRRKA